MLYMYIAVYNKIDLILKIMNYSLIIIILPIYVTVS